ncbi:hypothetical protein [Mesorhizobium sp. ANAO-SY3R2]|uniref:hypothetical protein n=1 Tax=Mesorhizobium sp. ANAO-SY3R2 TaxID=3166644 RepID=UPI0036713EC0
MSVESEFKAIKALFEVWAVAGVPTGIRYPKTQSGAVGWSCEQFGIKGVGSRRDFRTTSPEHGTIVKEIKDLIAKLKPVEEVGTLKRNNGKVEAARGYRTQKERRFAAEDQTAHYRAMLENTLTQLQETRQTLASLERDLKVELQRAAELRRENAKFQEDNAQLKRLLVTRNGILHIVEQP